MKKLQAFHFYDIESICIYSLLLNNREVIEVPIAAERGLIYCCAIICHKAFIIIINNKIKVNGGYSWERV